MERMTVKTIEVDDTQEQMKNLLSLVQQDIEVVITQNETPIAKVVPLVEYSPVKRVAGLNRGSTSMSDDFDEPLEDDFWLGE